MAHKLSVSCDNINIWFYEYGQEAGLGIKMLLYDQEVGLKMLL